MTGNMDIAFSSRIRLARNIEGLPFTGRMTTRQKEELIKNVKNAADGSLMLMHMSELPMRERLVLVERHLISPDIARSDSSAALINREETISILVGEEDHIRIQCIEPGFALERAYVSCLELDEALSQKLDYVFDSELGFITACPTNLGTGMRASVMLHLPVFSALRQIDSLITALSKLGCTIRGFYGEGSGAPGHIYQLSNQITLGGKEEDILNTLNETVLRVIEREMAMRGPFYEKNKLDIDDRVYRSLGALRFARRLMLQEAMEYISNLKLGASIGLLPGDAQNILNKLLADIQDASTEQRAGEELSKDKRECARAEYVRKEIAQIEKMYYDSGQRGESE